MEPQRIDRDSIRQKIFKAISELTSQGKMFTVFDLTKWIRSSGEYAPHGEVRDLFWQISAESPGLIPSTYEQKTIRFKNSFPLLYCPIGSNVDEYKPLEFEQTQG